MKFPKLEITEKNLRKSLIVPIAILALAIILLFVSYAQTGQVLKLGIDFEGGIQLTVHYTDAVDTGAFESALQKRFDTFDASVITTTNPATRRQEALVITLGGDYTPEELILAVEEYLSIELTPSTYSITALGPTLAASFFQQAKWAFSFAFLFMGAVVAIYYRKLRPSIAIIASTIYDLIIILGFMAFLQIPLSLSTLAALLMIIGYGVDTNILLTNKVLKEKGGTVFDRITSGFHTGLTMSATTIAVLLALLFVGGAYALVFRHMALILLVGLIADIPNTWSLNASILTWNQK